MKTRFLDRGTKLQMKRQS